jgi:hypothetical protein
MEILIVVLLLIIIVGALVFAWTKFGPRAQGRATGVSRRSGGIRGSRGARAAARRGDPMAEAVERHAQATDPREAAEAELALQAQANRVASDLHAREAAALESRTRGAGARHSAPPPGYADGREPVYGEGGRPAAAAGEPVYEDEYGRPVYEDGTPAADPREPVYEDEHGRPVYGEDRPRY